MATKAGIWIRVSTGKQDEANQEPDVLKHCSERGYDITRRYEVHDRSAFKGEQDAELEKMLMDVRTRKIEVLVFWHSDRLERRGTEALFADLRNVREAGGRFESVQEQFLGESDMAGTVMTAIAGATAHQYSAHLSDQVSLSVSRVRANGALWGNSHWGYEITGEKYNKTLVPTEEGKLYIPEIFQRIADGQSIHKVGVWLRSGPRPGIADRTVHRIIHNRVYMGTKMANGVPVMEVPPLVDAKLWQQANDRLKNAPRGRRTPASGKSAFLTGCLFCRRCARDGKYAPMYRIRTGRSPHIHYYYRCRGHAPGLKSCGNMVKLEVVDWWVVQLINQAQDPWIELRRIEGENYDADLVKVQLALSDLAKRGLKDSEEDSERKRLRAERDRLTELNKDARPDYWDEVPVCATCGSEWRDACETAGHHKRTIAEHFMSLDDAQQRAMLVENVKVYAEAVHDVEKPRKLSEPNIDIHSWLFRLQGGVLRTEWTPLERV